MKSECEVRSLKLEVRSLPQSIDRMICDNPVVD